MLMLSAGPPSLPLRYILAAPRVDLSGRYGYYGDMETSKPYRYGGNVASTRVPTGTTKREARTILTRMVTADYPAARFYGGTTLAPSRMGGLLVMVCCDLDG